MEIIDLNFQNTPHTIASFLIDAVEPILVETGPDSTFKNLIIKLKALGLNQQDIKHVLITHIHLDHSGAAWHFAQSKAKIYVHPKGKKHLIDPSHLVSSAQIVYKDKLKSLFGNVEPINKDNVIEVDDEKEINICGTKVLPIYTKGHANHHACFLINEYMFVGDAGGIRILDGPIMPPTPPPDINLKEWMLSIEKLKQYDAPFICPTHFGCFTNFNHFDELASHIMQYKIFIQNSQDYNQFLKFIDTFFSDEQIRQLYKIANPDEMNFEGLLRYFKSFEN
ncbi:metallo-beta-lactamase protein [Desulfurella amilsii]|uniref:Metallo-beta-lactamase protein n=1 Tax=Desulfurella amilsii TaxID=1562698 RepID=A0A1X4XXT1_9BACT|nr:MBL fold metallo-hydrolase [Desulfurella amilsii]OSS42341.1 metallo-beta-lactamase protein [Desulfurella amilsii]